MVTLPPFVLPGVHRAPASGEPMNHRCAPPHHDSFTRPGLAERGYLVQRNFSIKFISETTKLKYRAGMSKLVERANFEPR
jgi:hypothetical protein